MATKKSKEDKIASFDFNGVADTNAGLFGLPFDENDAEVVIIPVPWEVTVSYSAGTSEGPLAVKEASPQLDLFDPEIRDAWKLGIWMDEISEEWQEQSTMLRDQSEKYIKWLEAGSPKDDNTNYEKMVAAINKKGAELTEWVKQNSLKHLKKGKMVGLLGGDHSTPLGLMQALAEHHEEFGILHVDAHCDLREAYEGFEYSHASIMYNALKIPQLKKIVQVGIRDLAQSEAELSEQSNGRVAIFYDYFLKEGLNDGKSWKKQCKKIVAQLPQKVYISFDIDGLDPKLCPGTGTPVPGGLEFDQAIYLLKALVKSGREIIGFDLVEVAPGDSEWNGNVGARLLYKLCNWMAVSQKKLEAPALIAK